MIFATVALGATDVARAEAKKAPAKKAAPKTAAPKTAAPKVVAPPPVAPPPPPPAAPPVAPPPAAEAPPAPPADAPAAAAEGEDKEKVFVTQETEVVDTKTYEVGTSQRAAWVYPNCYGTAGIFRTRSAESLPDGALAFGICGEFYSISNAPNFGQIGGDANTLAESIFIGYAPVENLTVSIMRRNSSTTFGQPSQLISSLGDFYLDGQYTFNLSPSFAVAPIANIQVASNFNSLTPAGTTLSVGVGAAGTFSLYPTTGVPIFTHLNVLYHMPQIRTNKQRTFAEPEAFFGFSRFDTVTFQLGGEYRLGDITPFVELQQVIQAGAGLSFTNHPSRFSFGARFTPLANKGLSLLVGAEVGIGKAKQNSNTLTPGVPFTPGYQILGQLAYTFGLTTTERKHYATTNDVGVVDRKFVLRKNVKFKVASAELEPESFVLLDQIAQVIKQNNVKRLLIVGHTDSSHTEDYNIKLSNDRAATVKAYLVKAGIPEESLTSQGYGKRKPKASNLTEEGRAENRRVEFLILE